MSGGIRVSETQALAALAVVAVTVLVYVVVDVPIGTIVVLPFALMGGIGLVLSGRMLLRSRERDGFTAVEVTVRAADLRSQTETNSGTTTTTYFPEITYEYTVDGETRTSDSVYPANVGGSNGSSKEQSVVDDHPEGATVTAYYHPDDPSRSFLVDGSQTKQAVFGVVVSVILGSIGVGGLVVLFT